MGVLPNYGARLTDRERQVLEGMSYGKSNPEIGRDLYVSESTVKTIARRMFHKLGARDRAHATRLGMEQGYLTSPSGDTPAQARGPIGQASHLAACWTGGGCQCPTRQAVA